MADAASEWLFARERADDRSIGRFGARCDVQLQGPGRASRRELRLLRGSWLLVRDVTFSRRRRRFLAQSNPDATKHVVFAGIETTIRRGNFFACVDDKMNEI